MDKGRVIFLSYGDDSFHLNKSGVLDRHIKYSESFDNMLVIHLCKRKNLPVIKRKNLSITPISGNNYAIAFLKAIIFILYKIDKRDFNIVTTKDFFLTGILGLFVKIFKGIKLHVQNHSSIIDNENWLNERKILNPFLNVLGKFIIKRADRLRVVNQLEKDIYVSTLGINPSLIDVFPVPSNITNNNDISNNEVLKFKEVNKITEPIVIGWAGRFVETKGINYLFKYTRLLIDNNHKVQLCLAGNYEKSFYDLRSLEKTYNIKPIYLGHIESRDLKLFFMAIDIYLHTSSYEGYGIVIRQALSFEKPVISYKSAGAIENIENGENGYLYEDKDEFIKYFELMLNQKDVLTKNIIKMNTLYNLNNFYKKTTESINKTIK